MDNFSSTPRLFDDFDRRKINSCGTVQPNRRDMPRDFVRKQVKIKRGDVRVRTREGLTVLVWKERWEVYMLTWTHHQQKEIFVTTAIAQWNLTLWNGTTSTWVTSTILANSYSISQHTFIWTTKLFFHILDLTVLNSWILLSSCGAKYTHQDFRLLLVRNSNEEAGKSQDHPTRRLVGSPSSGAKNILRLENCHNKHWSAKSSTQLRCHLCSSCGQRKGTVYKCARCDMGMCMVSCFEEYHTKVTL